MPIEFKLPELGENIDAADVVNIMVSPGDVIAKEQAVLELETEKAVLELPSPYAGRIEKINVKTGDHIPVGALVMTLEPTEEGQAKPEPQKEQEQPKAQAEPKEEPQPQQPAPERKSAEAGAATGAGGAESSAGGAGADRGTGARGSDSSRAAYRRGGRRASATRPGQPCHPPAGTRVRCRPDPGKRHRPSGANHRRRPPRSC